MPVLSWMRNDFQISAVMVNIKNHHLTQMKLAYISRYFLVLNEAWKFIFFTVKYLVKKKKSHNHSFGKWKWFRYEKL